MCPRAWLVDASIYIFRAWFALPPNSAGARGFSTHAVAGFGGFLAQLLERERPQHMVVAFDESLGSCFRHAIHPGYKKRRALPDEALAFQLRACRELVQVLGLSELASERYEADDLVASAAHHARAQGLACTVLSRDKDLGQVLLGEADRLWDFPAGAALDRAAWSLLNGIRPEQVPDLLALTGDAIDDIPGVPGIGRKTAVSLLGEYADIEAVLASTGAIAASGRRGAARIAAALAANGATVRLARRLTGLCEDALESPPRFVRVGADAAVLRAFCLAHGLGARLQTRLLRTLEPA